MPFRNQFSEVFPPSFSYEVHGWFHVISGPSPEFGGPGATYKRGLNFCSNLIASKVKSYFILLYYFQMCYDIQCLKNIKYLV
jgi:hypothetical protein